MNNINILSKKQTKKLINSLSKTKQKRIKWDKRYIAAAKLISTWSSDPSTQVGALIVGGKGQIVSQGYNGFPRNIDDSEERYANREVKYKYICHAEMNAIYNAVHNNTPTKDCDIYVYGLPICHECAKAIIQVGIKTVYMADVGDARWNESCDLAKDMLKEAGVKFKTIKCTK